MHIAGLRHFIERALEILFDTGVALALILSIWIVEVACDKFLHGPNTIAMAMQISLFQFGHVLVLLHWLKSIWLRVVPVPVRRKEDRR